MMPRALALPRRCRLSSPTEISQVFDFVDRRASSSHFTALARPNDLSFPRIAIMVPKRTAKAAPRRNYMRRVAREYFRREWVVLGSIDVVIKIKTTFKNTDYAVIMQELGAIFTKLQKCRAP